MSPLSPSASLVAPSTPWARGAWHPMAARAGEVDERYELVVTRSPSERDWQMIRTFVESLERDDLHWRFGLAIDFRDEASLRRYFGVDPKSGEIAWMLDGRSPIAAISHRVRISPCEAEIALIVRSDLKRTGIGGRMLSSLIRRSRQERLRTLSAQILSENRAMLGLARRAGFVARGTLGLNVEMALALGPRGAD
jgi:RimJ/RimL family protein N-acetyltransferase